MTKVLEKGVTCRKQSSCWLSPSGFWSRPWRRSVRPLGAVVQQPAVRRPRVVPKREVVPRRAHARRRKLPLSRRKLPPSRSRRVRSAGETSQNASWFLRKKSAEYASASRLSFFACWLAPVCDNKKSFLPGCPGRKLCGVYIFFRVV